MSLRFPAVHGVIRRRLLEDIRPKRFPRMLGLSSGNAAHRMAVLWDEKGGVREGGGRVVPGEHHKATFDCGLLMRNIGHEWHAADDMYV